MGKERMVNDVFGDMSFDNYRLLKGKGGLLGGYVVAVGRGKIRSVPNYLHVRKREIV